MFDRNSCSNSGLSKLLLRSPFPNMPSPIALFLEITGVSAKGSDIFVEEWLWSGGAIFGGAPSDARIELSFACSWGGALFCSAGGLCFSALFCLTFCSRNSCADFPTGLPRSSWASVDRQLTPNAHPYARPLCARLGVVGLDNSERYTPSACYVSFACSEAPFTSCCSCLSASTSAPLRRAVPVIPGFRGEADRGNGYEDLE